MCIIIGALLYILHFLHCLLLSVTWFTCSWYSLSKSIATTGDNSSTDCYLRSKALKHFPHWAGRIKHNRHRTGFQSK